MVEILNSDGNVIRTSKNLRGLLTHMRHNRVERVACLHGRSIGRGLLGVKFANGDSCSANFASYAVMCNWIRTRKNLFESLLITEQGTAGMVSRDNEHLCANSYPTVKL